MTLTPAPELDQLYLRNSLIGGSDGERIQTADRFWELFAEFWRKPLADDKFPGFLGETARPMSRTAKGLDISYEDLQQRFRDLAEEDVLRLTEEGKLLPFSYLSYLDVFGEAAKQDFISQDIRLPFQKATLDTLIRKIFDNEISFFTTQENLNLFSGIEEDASRRETIGFAAAEREIYAYITGQDFSRIYRTLAIVKDVYHMLEPQVADALLTASIGYMTENRPDALSVIGLLEWSSKAAEVYDAVFPFLITDRYVGYVDKLRTIISLDNTAPMPAHLATIMYAYLELSAAELAVSIPTYDRGTPEQVKFDILWPLASQADDHDKLKAKSMLESLLETTLLRIQQPTPEEPALESYGVAVKLLRIYGTHGKPSDSVTASITAAAKQLESAGQPMESYKLSLYAVSDPAPLLKSWQAQKEALSNVRITKNISERETHAQKLVFLEQRFGKLGYGLADEIAHALNRALSKNGQFGDLEYAASLIKIYKDNSGFYTKPISDRLNLPEQLKTPLTAVFQNAISGLPSARFVQTVQNGLESKLIVTAESLGLTVNGLSQSERGAYSQRSRTRPQRF